MTCYDKFLKKLKTIKHKKGLQALREERGAIFVLTALMLPVLLGCMGIAYDVGNLYMHKARLQNVTDAAALAGGGLFKNPPEKAEPTEADEYISATSGKVVKLVNSEEVIVKEIQNVDYKDGTTIKDREGGITVTTNSPNHVKADLEAKRYIERNAVNLGNLITTEELSALAYNDSKTTKVNGTPTTSGNVTTTVNTETTKVTDAKFYRVIASEEVPLYFLPVILGENKRIQTVRTTSVAMLDNTTETTKTTTITVTAGGSVIPSGGKTVLDNLFTFSNSFYVPNKFDNDDNSGSSNRRDNVKNGYDGDIIYTNSSATFYFREQTDALKYMFPDPDAAGIKLSAYEIIDQYMHYAEYNSSYGNIASEDYKSSFMKKFTSPSNTSKIDNIASGVSITSSYLNGEINNGKSIFIYNQSVNQGDLKISDSLNGNSNEPIFLLYGEDHQKIELNITADTVRPVVVVYLGSSEFCLYNSSGGTFRGVIYAPNTIVKIDNNVNFKFYGNIITKDLQIQGGGWQEFHQVNYLKDDPDFSNLTKSTSSSTISQEDLQETFDNKFKESVQELVNGTNSRSIRDAAKDKSVYTWVYNNLYNNNAGNEGVLINDTVEINNGNEYYTDSQFVDGNKLVKISRADILRTWLYAYESTVSKIQDFYGDSFQLSDLNRINKSPWDPFSPPIETGSATSNTTTQENSNTNSLPTQFRLINPRTETNPYFAPDSDI